MRKHLYISSVSSLLLLLLLCAHQLKADCQSVDFSVTKTETCINDVLYLTATGMPNNSSYQWHINGEVLNRTNPQTAYAFIEAGVYTVTLIITLPNQTTCTITKDNFIAVNPYPEIPDIVASKNPLCDINEEVTISAVGSATNIVRWDWGVDPENYQDAGSSIEHSFGTPGYKLINLRVVDDFGCQNSKNIDSVIYVYDAPDLDFSVEADGQCLPVEAEITPDFDLKQHDMISFNWTFPGAEPATAKGNSIQIIEYNEKGDFDIKIEVENSAGCIYDFTSTNIINIGKKENLSFEYNPSDLNSCEFPGTIEFTNSTENIDISKLSWEYSGGIRETPFIYNKLKLRFEAGTLNVKMIYNDNGCISEVSEKFENVTTGSPVAKFKYDPDCSCKPPLTVNFTNTSTQNQNIPITEYEWWFTKGGQVLGTSNQENPSFTFMELGHFRATLKVTDSVNCSSTQEHSIIIKPPTATIVSTPKDTACINEPIVFNTHKDSVCVPEIETIKWTFFDSNGVDILDSSFEISPSFTYYNEGSYNVGLEIQYYDQECFDDTIIENYLYVVGNIIDSIVPLDTVKACFHTYINFQFPGMEYLKNNRYVDWVFRNQESGQVIIFEDRTSFDYSFTQAGYYDLTFIVRNDFGCIDSLRMERVVQISGISADFSVTNAHDCTPLHTKIEGVVNYNILPDGYNEDIAFTWSLNDTITNQVINLEDKVVLNAVIENAGVFDVTLIAENSMGCISKVEKKNHIQAEIFGNFKMQPQTCQRTKINIEEASIPRAKSIKWKIGADTYTLDGGYDSENIQISIPKSGNHEVRMIVESDLGCKDTVIKTLNVLDFSADFLSPDTNGICSPALIEFEALPVNANYFTWRFGDHFSYSTNDVDVSHVFDLQALNTWTKAFDIHLVYENTALNCIDSITKEEYVTVYGALPKMDVSAFTGCNPFSVEFTDQSINAVKTYINFGDGSELDSLKPVYSNTYETSDSHVAYETFEPFLLAWDENNCRSVYRPEQKITVYNPPIADFSTPDTAGCEPYPVKFNNHSLLSHTYQWDFYNDGIINSNAVNPEFTFTEPGYIDVKLIANNQYGCSDTLSKPNYINTSPLPVPDFELFNDIICFDDTVFFKDKSSGKYPIIEWTWDFGGPTKPEGNSSSQNPFRVYDKVGKHHVSLTVKDSFGCEKASVFYDAVIIRDTLPPPNKGIKYITVENDRHVNVNWYENPIEIFRHYTLYKLQPDQKELVFDKVSDSRYNDRNVDVMNENHCFRLQIEDQCDNFSEKSSIHCQVLLSTSFQDSNATRLDWTAYQGWNGVKEYRIFRKEDGSNNYTYLNSVAGNVTTYIDSPLCNIEYCYYVEAVHPNKGYISKSNTACYQPPYRFDETVPLVLRSTVPDNENVLTEFELPGHFYNTQSYLIYRAHNNISSAVFYKEIESRFNQFIDQNVDVHNRSYEYFLARRDLCKNLSGLSNYGKSIVLRSKIESEDEISLSWNPYKEWENGVSHYKIERQTKGDTFMVIKDNVMPEIQFYTDSDPELLEKHNLCYRVTAYERDGNGQYSQSNISCGLFPSRLFVPNAFSPNQDDLNDIFIPFSVSIYYHTGNPELDYSFRIFSRWGELLFETDDPNVGWDGKLDGELQPEGVYIYTIRATGKDQKNYELHGNVTLIR